LFVWWFLGYFVWWFFVIVVCCLWLGCVLFFFFVGLFFLWSLCLFFWLCFLVCLVVGFFVYGCVWVGVVLFGFLSPAGVIFSVVTLRSVPAPGVPRPPNHRATRQGSPEPASCAQVQPPPRAGQQTSLRRTWAGSSGLPELGPGPPTGGCRPAGRSCTVTGRGKGRPGRRLGGGASRADPSGALPLAVLPIGASVFDHQPAVPRQGRARSALPPGPARPGGQHLVDLLVGGRRGQVLPGAEPVQATSAQASNLGPWVAPSRTHTTRLAGNRQEPRSARPSYIDSKQPPSSHTRPRPPTPWSCPPALAGPDRRRSLLALTTPRGNAVLRGHTGPSPTNTP